MSTILVTGSLGTIGSKLVRELSGRGHHVHGCDLWHGEFEYGVRVCPFGSYQRCDVGSYRQIEALIKRVMPDFVYHAAAEFGRWNGEDFYETLWRTNAVGTKHIIRLQEAVHPFGLIHFSSSEVYGDLNEIMSENHALDNLPLNDYAMTKRVNEWQIKTSAQQHGTKSVIVRLFNTYGPGERYSPYRSVNCRFLYHAMKGLPLRVFGGHRRTSTYIDDTITTLANIVTRFYPGEIYNIAGKVEHTILELAELAVEAMGAEHNLIQVFPESEPMTTTRKRVSIAKAVQQLGHKITVGLEDGMKKTAEWMKNEYLR